MPVSPSEARFASLDADLELLAERGGFPEPLLAADTADAGRWRRQYLDGLVLEDILSFENVRELRSMGLLVERLRDRVGSPLSLQSLSEDLGISPNTVKRHLEILEALYIVFFVYPHSRDMARALTKRPKVYFFDTGLVRGGRGPAFEILVAVSLLKRQYALEDADGMSRPLRYLRTKEGREVDFVLCEEENPRLMVEAKTSEHTISPHLRWYHERYGIQALQLVAELRQAYDDGGIAVRHADPWLAALEA